MDNGLHEKLVSPLSITGGARRGGDLYHDSHDHCSIKRIRKDEDVITIDENGKIKTSSRINKIGKTFQNMAICKNVSRNETKTRMDTTKAATLPKCKKFRDVQLLTTWFKKASSAKF